MESTSYEILRQVEIENAKNVKKFLEKIWKLKGVINEEAGN